MDHTNLKPKTKDVLSEESSYVTLKLLEGVTKFGSGARLSHNIPEDERNYIYKNVVTGYPYKFDNAIAGKTGTTQRLWFLTQLRLSQNLLKNHPLFIGHVMVHLNLP